MSNKITNINGEEVKFIKFKHLKYKDERLQILNNIYKLLEIDEKNKVFKSHLIDADENIQKQILDMSDDISKYFKVAGWPAYKNFNTERRYLSIIKSILKDMNIKFTSISCKTKFNNTTINTTIYTIE